MNDTETIKIELPKPIVAFLRYKAADDNRTLEQELEIDVIADVRGELEGFEGEELIQALGIGPIFWKVLEDENYKPKDAEPPTEKTRELLVDAETYTKLEDVATLRGVTIAQYVEKLVDAIPDLIRFSKAFSEIEPAEN